ncbi:uncharacterized protein LOC115746453 [Rhodamnia argentea]|uniref:Uncharacterized protein LOC115746453 n=1 Tax=Rhodamnia argentea TaxID=178133 RepID=A0A8B8PTI8_9MYRT|nr:uncharacterized protein LOC115746453 [Rhodamnia argentea]
MDAVLRNISRTPGPVYTYNYFIYRDPTTGLWWLELGDDYTVVGFWPKVIFSGGGLQDLATYIEWGGQVYSPPDIPSPPMGRGALPLPNILYDASCQDMTTINENHDTEAAGGTQTYADQDKYYRAKDMGCQKAPLNRTMAFGGPGGATGWARRGHRLGLTGPDWLRHHSEISYWCSIVQRHVQY